jgi:predicted Zn-dependent protease with MMP-like domain
MTREDFEMAVSEGLDLVPADLAAQMDNVVVLVEDDAPAEDPGLLGLYEGVPLTERDHMWAAGALPDRITIFRNPTLAICDSRDDVVEEVAVTVVHEIAHHFGIDDDRPASVSTDQRQYEVPYSQCQGSGLLPPAWAHPGCFQPYVPALATIQPCSAVPNDSTPPDRSTA